MPDLTNPITGGTVTVSDDLAADFVSRGFRAAEPEPEADKPAPKRGRPRKADTDGD